MCANTFRLIYRGISSRILLLDCKDVPDSQLRKSRISVNMHRVNIAWRLFGCYTRVAQRLDPDMYPYARSSLRQFLIARRSTQDPCRVKDHHIRLCVAIFMPALTRSCSSPTHHVLSRAIQRDAAQPCHGYRRRDNIQRRRLRNLGPSRNPEDSRRIQVRVTYFEFFTSAQHCRCRYPGQSSSDYKIPSVLYYTDDGRVRAVGAEAYVPGFELIVEDEDLIFVDW